MKHMVTGRLVEGSDREPIALGDGEVSAADEFPYLGSFSQLEEMDRRVI